MGTDPSKIIAIVLPLAFAAVGVACIVYVFLRRHWRNQAFKSLAADLGLTYTPRVAATEGEDVEDLRRGFGTGLIYINHLAGKHQGLSLEIFDQMMSQILCGSSMNSQTVVELSHEDLTLPEFILQPENWLSMNVHWVDGSDGMKFADDMEFSLHNFVRGDSPKEIRESFNDVVRRLLRKNEDQWIQCSGSSLRFYRAGVKLEPGEIREMIERGVRITRAFLGEPVGEKDERAAATPVSLDVAAAADASVDEDGPVPPLEQG